jgi:hypothetical protein
MGLWAVAVLSAQMVAGEVLGMPHLHHLYVGDAGDAAQGRVSLCVHQGASSSSLHPPLFNRAWAAWHYPLHCGNHAIPHIHTPCHPVPGNDVGAVVASPSLKPRSDTTP